MTLFQQKTLFSYHYLEEADNNVLPAGWHITEVDHLSQLPDTDQNQLQSLFGKNEWRKRISKTQPRRGKATLWLLKNDTHCLAVLGLLDREARRFDGVPLYIRDSSIVFVDQFQSDTEVDSLPLLIRHVSKSLFLRGITRMYSSVPAHVESDQAKLMDSGFSKIGDFRQLQLLKYYLVYWPNSAAVES